MNKTNFRLSGLIILAGILAMTSVQAADEAGKAVEKIDVNTAQEYVAQHENAVIMDVRTPAEFDLSHITGAMNINVQDDDFESMAAGLDSPLSIEVPPEAPPEAWVAGGFSLLAAEPHPTTASIRVRTINRPVQRPKFPSLVLVQNIVIGVIGSYPSLNIPQNTRVPWDNTRNPARIQRELFGVIRFNAE